MHPRSLSIRNSDKATSDMTKFAHCATTETSQWRRGTDRRKIGNACVLTLGKAKDLSSEGAGDVDDDFKFLLETENSIQLEETVKKHSDEVSQTLSHMEQQLEELLDTVVSKCRQMTQPEKQKLLKQVKNLHPKNLDHVVEIIKRKEPTESPSSEDIFVDLEKQENVTLWRLYFYIQAVENTRKLSA
ncbi:Transcription factor GTE6-like protein [Drosera capensis]